MASRAQGTGLTRSREGREVGSRQGGSAFRGFAASRELLAELQPAAELAYDLFQLKVMAQIDHIILKVSDVAASVAFYTEVLGFAHAGMDGPFTVLRVSPDFTLQLAPWGTEGNEHYAFALSRADFDRVFERIVARGIDYGDSFHSVGTNGGPGIETGARGPAPTLYFFDPNHHLIEIRTYDEST